MKFRRTIQKNEQYFAEIVAIIVIDERAYFLIDEKFTKIKDKNCKHIHFLERNNKRKLNLISPKLITHKYAFVDFSNTLAVSKFPNFYERI